MFQLSLGHRLEMFTHGSGRRWLMDTYFFHETRNGRHKRVSLLFILLSDECQHSICITLKTRVLNFVFNIFHILLKIELFLFNAIFIFIINNSNGSGLGQSIENCFDICPYIVIRYNLLSFILYLY